MTDRYEPNLYELVRGIIEDWGEYNQAMGPVRQAEIVQRLDRAFYKLRDAPLVWDIAEQKLYVERGEKNHG